MSPIPADEQHWSDRWRRRHELCHRIECVIARGDRLVAELHQIRESLAELDKRVAALKGSLWPIDKRE
jgi:hypothetical protein